MKNGLNTGFPVICRTREMFFPAAEVLGSPVFLCV